MSTLQAVLNAAQWRRIHQAAFGNPYKDEPKICVVSTRYQGGYEGGLFAALPVSELDGPAFGQDCACADWWDENRASVGIGATPDEALADWHEKLERRR